MYTTVILAQPRGPRLRADAVYVDKLAPPCEPVHREDADSWRPRIVLRSCEFKKTIPKSLHEDDGDDLITIILVAAACALTRTIAMISLPSSSWPPLFAKMPPTAPRIGPDIKNQLKSIKH